jgi:hypothetical protein
MADRNDEDRARDETEERQRRVDHREKLLDEALKESFPASDPPSIARPHRT